MIKKFTVKNFKNFKKELILDFAKVRDYEFKEELIKNNLVNKALIYGVNNSGKSNLGAAIMDITTHLTDNIGIDNVLYNNYINGDTTDDMVEFKYEFLFNNKNVTYSYKKDSNRKLIEEELLENDNLLFKYNYNNSKYENNIEEAQTLDLSKRNNLNTSVLKYIYNNTLYWKDSSAIKQLMEFVNHMLWFRSVRGNEFIGNRSSGESMDDFIINNNLLGKFEKFLKEYGQTFKLDVIQNGDRKYIGVKYKNYTAFFQEVASTGTKSLELFFYWMNQMNKISFLYLDEFDAFYNYALSEEILKFVNGKSDFQSILTSHNTYLITNELMRPDNYLLLKNGNIKSFAESTNKVIRQAHNLERMMLGGEFE